MRLSRGLTVRSRYCACADVIPATCGGRWSADVRLIEPVVGMTVA